MIEPVSNKTINELLPLIKKYQEFYQVSDISDKKNEVFFSQFGEKSSLGCQFLYRDTSKVIGFATVYFSFASTIPAKIAILNDLYTLPEHRGKGVAKTLIKHCQNYAATNGVARLQWVTAPDNKQAQFVYDSLNTKKSLWYFYTKSI